jgi:hypothetical protein
MSKIQSALEEGFKTAQPNVEAKALELYKKSQSEAINYLTQYSNRQVKDGVAEWKKLGEYLMVKYVDGVIKREENGTFKRNPYGLPASPIRPGYTNEYYKKIVEQTGDKYKVEAVN